MQVVTTSRQVGGQAGRPSSGSNTACSITQLLQPPPPPSPDDIISCPPPPPLPPAAPVTKDDIISYLRAHSGRVLLSHLKAAFKKRLTTHTAREEFKKLMLQVREGWGGCYVLALVCVPSPKPLSPIPEPYILTA